MYIAPSLLAADFSALGEEIARVKQAEMLHIDIMDGVFVPNISMGPAVVSALRDKTSQIFDVHLMLLHPKQYVEAFRKAGADCITFHIESEDDPGETIDAILATGAKAGLAVKPDTPIEAILPYGEKLSQVTIMTVEPGFGGQSMIERCLEKIPALKKALPHVLAEVDGGVNRTNAHLCHAAGADILVAGTAVFRAENPQEEMAFLAGGGL